MTTSIRVVVCGSSLYVTGLAASLETYPEVSLVRMPASTASLLPCIDEFAPALVIFGLDELPGDFAVSLFRDRAELVLVGVDPSSDRMLVLSGRQVQPVSAAELLAMITRSSADRSLCCDERTSTLR